jgi:hypothetical protein
LGRDRSLPRRRPHRTRHQHCGKKHASDCAQSENALFAGHDQGAENWAAIASLVETCKLYGVDPQAYFADVLTRLVNLWPASRLDELMPWAWAAQRSADRLAA